MRRWLRSLALAALMMLAGAGVGEASREIPAPRGLPGKPQILRDTDSREAPAARPEAQPQEGPARPEVRGEAATPPARVGKTDFHKVLASLGASTPGVLKWSGNYLITADLTIPAHITLHPEDRATLTLAPGTTLNMQGGIAAGLRTVFIDNSGSPAKGVKFARGAVAYVRPEWWGARGDGNASEERKNSNATAINQAIAALANCGGTVKFSGQYRVNRTMTMRSWVHLAGEAPMQVFTNAPRATEIISNNCTLFDAGGAASLENFSVKNIIFSSTAPKSAEPLYALNFNASRDTRSITIEGCQFTGWNNNLHAAGINGTLHIFHIINNGFFQCAHAVQGMLYDSLVMMNELDGGGPHVMVWRAKSYAVGDQVRPTDDKLNGFYYECTRAGAAGGSQPQWPAKEGARVTDGGVIWTARTGPAALYYFGAKNTIGKNIFNAGGIVTSAGAADNVIEGNLFDTILGYGFKHNGGAARLTLANNNFTNCALDGINISNGNCTIIGNTFNLIGTAGNTVGGYGVNLNTYQLDSIVKNNTFGKCALGKVNSTFSGVFNNLRFNGGVVEDNIGIDVGGSIPTLPAGAAPNVSTAGVYKSNANGQIINLINNCPGKRLRLVLADTGTSLNTWGIDAGAKVYACDQSAGSRGWSENLYNTGGWNFFPAKPAVKDAIYFGNGASRFAGVRVYPAESPGGRPTYSWYYWNGTGWRPLSVTRADIFSEAGGYRETLFTPPDDWMPFNLAADSGPSSWGYFVKVVITAQPPPRPGRNDSLRKAQQSYLRLKDETISLGTAGDAAVVDLLNVNGVFFQH